MSIQHIAVIGAGTMGNGITQVCAASGYKVIMIDVVPAALEKGRAIIDKSLSKFVEKGRLSADDKAAALGRISLQTELAAARESDLVVEAATETPDLKLKIFRELDSIARPEIILASNTSSISLTKIGGATKRPDKVIGMHFMNPVPMMTLVEIIRGLGTSDETTATVMELSRKLGKTPVEANDSPGFISNRILCPMINEAIYALMEGVGTKEAIDTVMKLGMNHPMGPLTLADLVGLDVLLYVMQVLHRDLGDDKYRPCPLLVRMVDAGYLGRKAGRGFYEYPA
ncbi:MAG TPA: 3-hydroxybutyryl-CoA dehydrogenase [Anaerolineales bacterium]|nr:3-hydroxybutyryl-CoA dehydrogenase [Anaerolineales bacterium]